MRQVKALWIPAFGIVEGGILAGWRFHFLRFRVVDGDPRVFARMSAPAWPFPHDMELEREHFDSLAAVPGERAKRLNADRLILAAYVVEGLPVPDYWLAYSKRMRVELKLIERQKARLAGADLPEEVPA